MRSPATAHRFLETFLRLSGLPIAHNRLELDRWAHNGRGLLGCGSAWRTTGIGVGTGSWTPPLPPNRTGDLLAYGSPVSGLLFEYWLLWPGASVGLDLTAPIGDARPKPPWPQPKSLAAAPLVIFKQALRQS